MQHLVHITHMNCPWTNQFRRNFIFLWMNQLHRFFTIQGMKSCHWIRRNWINGWLWELRPKGKLLLKTYEREKKRELSFWHTVFQSVFSTCHLETMEIMKAKWFSVVIFPLFSRVKIRRTAIEKHLKWRNEHNFWELTNFPNILASNRDAHCGYLKHKWLLYHSTCGCVTLWLVQFFGPAIYLSRNHLLLDRMSYIVL